MIEFLASWGVKFGLLEPTWACKAAVYGTEGQRFESSRARLFAGVSGRTTRNPMCVAAGVTRAVRKGIARIGEHDPQLGEHLTQAVRTGTYCAYVPDPSAPAAWTS